MKLLALRLCEHDSSFCYFNGYELKYIKLERIKGIKHFAYNDLSSWINDFQNIFNEDINDISEIAIIVDSWIYDIESNIKNILYAEFNHLNLRPKVWRINHHYAHALSNWMLLESKPQADFVIDGFGDLDIAWTIFNNDKFKDCGSLNENGSLGHEMVQLGSTLGINSHYEIDVPGKLMSLQSYGNYNKNYADYIKKFKSLNTIRNFFDYSHWLNFIKDDLICNLKRLDFANTLHVETAEIICDTFSKYAKDNDIITFSGGVAQNIVWNTFLKKKFKNLIIPPHSADEGLTLGAIEWLRIKNKLPAFSLNNFPYEQYDEKPKSTISDNGISLIAKLLSQGKIIGWYQNHGEIGPRALGNRSILVDPRLTNGKDLINRIKMRENYRPFGASVLDEYKNEYFDGETDLFMLYYCRIKNPEKLPAINHVDNSCRVQSLKNENRVFRRLLENFYFNTKCPVLLNTSLNLSGKPLAGSISDALEIYNSTTIDAIVIGDNIFQKT